MSYLLYAAASFLLAFLSAKPIINYLYKLKSIQSFREQGPQSHIEEKAGTPTMGGWIFLLAIFLVSLVLYFQSFNKILLLSLFALLIGAGMGALDDGLKVIKANYAGISSKQKLLIQFLASTAIVYFSGRYLFADINPGLPEWVGSLTLYWEFIWAFVVIAGTTNAINLSDGLDGLATLLSALAFAGIGYKLWLDGDFTLSCFTVIVIAALLAFLIFNFKPAKVFMGDTGSLALGMCLGSLAYMSNLEWYLLVFALVPVLETLSVILQVASAKYSKRFLGEDRRLFRMAPLHHHFELCGWHELVVVIGFTLFQLGISLVWIKFML